MKTTVSQATATVQLCRDHDHGRDLGLGLGLYQPWHRLLRWWRLGLGRDAMTHKYKGSQ
jgi:hypothetical protein